MLLDRKKIAIIDDKTDVRHSLIAHLRTQKNLTLVAIGVDAKDACKIAVKQSPDIMVIGRDIPGGGLATVRAIRAIQQSTECIILAPADDAKLLDETKQAGAIAYVEREPLHGPLIRIIEAVQSVGRD